MSAYATIFISYTLALLSTISSQPSAFDPVNHQNWALLNDGICGISQSARIIGGTEASLGQYPWLARLGYTPLEDEEAFTIDKYVFRCGGVIISKYYTLTAAHCINVKPEVVRVGDHNSLTNPDCNGDFCAAPFQDIVVLDAVAHQRGQIALRNDIALIRGNTPFMFNGWVAPICMPYGYMMQKNFTGEMAEVAGWGLYNYSIPMQSNVLLTVSLPIGTNARCQQMYRNKADVGDTQMCVGGEIGKDSCGGDSGGPLMKVESLNDHPRYFVIGVVSFGLKRCGSTRMPGVYTRVSSFMLWILNNITY